MSLGNDELTLPQARCMLNERDGSLSMSTRLACELIGQNFLTWAIDKESEKRTKLIIKTSICA